MLITKSNFDTKILLLLLLLLATGSRSNAQCTRLPKKNSTIDYDCKGVDIEKLVDNLPNNTQIIRIKNTVIDRLESRHLSPFIKLSTLIIMNCTIKYIEDRTFYYNKNLTSLYLSNNQLENLRALAFEGLHSLKNMIVINDKIKLVEDDVFHDKLQLVHLDLSNNQLIYFDTKTLSKLNNLKTINLKNNPDFNCIRARNDFKLNRNASSYTFTCDILDEDD